MYGTIEQRKAELVRKANAGGVFISDYVADPIDKLTVATGTAPNQVITLAPLPTGWRDLGWLSEEGIGHGREIASSDIGAFGSPQPVRSDVTTDSTTLTCTAIETNLTTIRLETGANTAALAPDAATGEVSIAKPARPSARYYRVLSLAVDTDEAGREIYIARFLPRAKITSFGDKGFASGDTPIQTGFTFQAFEDSELGYSDKYIFAGPGWKALLTQMGFSA